MTRLAVILALTVAVAGCGESTTPKPVPVATVTVEPSTVMLEVGQQRVVEAKVRNASGGTLGDRFVQWQTSAANVATLSTATDGPTATVVAIAPGVATISAISEGKSASATITVTPVPVATVVIEPSSVSLAAGQERLLATTLRDAAGAVLTGRVVQWQSSAPAIASIATSGNGASATLSAVAPGVATISAISEGKSASASITVVSPTAVDFSITAAQWTQGSQQPDGSIPMVLDGNAAVLNVVMSTTIANRAPGQLVLTLTDAAGVLVRSDTVAPAAFSGAMSNEAPTAQFLVPSFSLRAGLRWRVRRDPRKVLVDSDSSNDAFPRAGTAALATVALPTLRVRFVPITLSSHGNATGNVSPANLESYLPMLRRVFPLGRLVETIGTPLVTSASFGTPPRGADSPFWLQVLQDLALARIVDQTAADESWMGVVVPPQGFNFAIFGGFAQLPATGTAQSRISSVVQTGWFTNTALASETVAHELAHTFGRRHAPCGGPSGPDPAFPLPSGTIGTAGHDVYAWWAGVTGFAATKAATMGDLMGYCTPVWISPYTYNGILQARIASGPIAVTAPAMARGQVVVVRGNIEDNRITLLPTVAVDGFATDGGSGSYRVELLGDDGRVLASQRTDALAVDHSSALTFVAALPIDERAAASIASVRVSGPAGTTSRRRSTAAPSMAGGSGVHALLRAVSSGRLEVTCTDSRTEAIVVQDHATGALLASSAGSRVTIDATDAVDIACSDGVRTERRRQLAR